MSKSYKSESAPLLPPPDLGVIERIQISSATAGLIGDGLIVLSLVPTQPEARNVLLVCGAVSVIYALFGWVLVRRSR